MPFHQAKRHYDKIRPLFIILALVLAGAVFIIFDDLPYNQRIVFSTMVLAGTLWITDAIPLFVTSMLIPLVIVLFGVLGPKEALNPFFDPIIVLFLGSLLIARGLESWNLIQGALIYYCHEYTVQNSCFLL